jgi:hypothetical protein
MENELSRFFRSDIIHLPLSRENGPLRSYQMKMFSDYRKFVADVAKVSDSSEPLLGAIGDLETSGLLEGLCGGILESLDLCIRGFPASAYDCFTLAMDKLTPHLKNLVSESQTSEVVGDLWRMRIEETNVRRLKRSDIFHIPFQDRHRVKQQRYSIPGLPCLYFGGSAYVCWEELGREPFHKLIVSRFRLAADNTINLLNFGERPFDILEQLSSDENLAPGTPKFDSIVAYAACWPLIAACSILKSHKDASFIEEYIIPQMVLQWIMKQDDYDGVRYSSTNIDASPSDSKFAANYAFPVKESLDSGICSKLSEQFICSEPVTWSLAQAGLNCPNEPEHKQTKLTIAGASSQRYSSTDFGLLEAKIATLPLERCLK